MLCKIFDSAAGASKLLSFLWQEQEWAFAFLDIVYGLTVVSCSVQRKYALGVQMVFFVLWQDEH